MDKSTRIEVGVDIGGSGTKISIKKQTQPDLSIPLHFKNQIIFKQKSKAGSKFAEAIVKVLNYYPPDQQYNHINIAISTTGDIDHEKNILLLSHRLNECESCNEGYINYQFADVLSSSLRKYTNSEAKVTLVHDSISPCFDPQIQCKLFMVMILGSYPVLSICQKKPQQIVVYDKNVQNWTDEIFLSNGINIQQNLKDSYLKKKDDLQNCSLLLESVIKILEKYKQIFQWQPQQFIILGGNAYILKHVKQWPKQVRHVKIRVITNYDQSVKSQMRGALFYSKNKHRIKIL